MLLPRLDLVPQSVANDPQFRNFLYDPVLGRIRTGLASARIGVLDKGLPVPDELADVELVVEDARAAPPIAVDRRRSPGSPLRPGDALSVKSLRDGTRGAATRELGKHTADDCRFGLIDGAAAGDRRAESVVLADNS